ncbi:MAG: AMP-binding protein, partial [Gemmatimonadetes bacterium]|nr:AMP-binding protein [Gemmatimonadota bacterium]
MNVADLLWTRARNAPDDPAVVTAGGVLSFRELRRSAASVAAGLGDRGIGLGDRVAISMPRGGEAVAAYFGVLAAGAVAVFVDQSFRPAQVANVLAHSESRLVLVGTDQSIAGVEG